MPLEVGGSLKVTMLIIPRVMLGKSWMNVCVLGIWFAEHYAPTIITNVTLYWAEGGKYGLKECVYMFVCVCRVTPVFL